MMAPKEILTNNIELNLPLRKEETKLPLSSNKEGPEQFSMLSILILQTI